MTTEQGDTKQKLFEDAAEALWRVVANASQGSWKAQTLEWQDAATRARDLYHQAIDAVPSRRAPLPDVYGPTFEAPK